MVYDLVGCVAQW